jgi:hypothetical protein
MHSFEVLFETGNLSLDRFATQPDRSACLFIEVVDKRVEIQLSSWRVVLSLDQGLKLEPRQGERESHERLYPEST